MSVWFKWTTWARCRGNAWHSKGLKCGAMPSRKKRGRPGKRGFPQDWIHPAAAYPPWANPYARRGRSPSSSEYEGSCESSEDERRWLDIILSSS